MNKLSELKFAGDLLIEAIETIEKRRQRYIYEGQIKEIDLDKYDEITNWNTQISVLKQHLKRIEERIMVRIVELCKYN
jgi:predicted RNA-binding protein